MDGFLMDWETEGMVEGRRKEWNGMEWNGEWNGMEWNGMDGWMNGMEWNGMDGRLEWNGMIDLENEEWNGMDGRKWKGMEWPDLRALEIDILMKNFKQLSYRYNKSRIILS